MTDWTPFLAGLLVFLSSAAWLLVRGRRELVETSVLSRTSFLAMVLWYVSVAFSVVWAAWTGAWQLPLDARPAKIFGGGLAILGEAVHLAARTQCRTRSTWGLQMPKLITTGIYRQVRHPQNLGWSLLLIGVALLGRSGAGLLVAGLYCVGSLLWLPAEDAALERRFGAVYTTYKSRTNAIIPSWSGFRGIRR